MGETRWEFGALKRYQPLSIVSIRMLSRPRTTNGAVDENHENRLAATHKTPSVKRPLESVENLPTVTPLAARKGLRDVTNSARKWDIASQNTSIRRPSKLSKVTNEEDIPEPEFAPVLSLEEENKLFLGIYPCTDCLIDCREL